MTTTTNVKQVKMNIMTQAQYDAITPVETELYAITDAELVTIDSALSASSENPVQNKVVYTALNGKQDTITSSAMLSSDLVDDTNKTHKFATASQLSQIATNTGDISTINGKIPSQASTSNQLADKNFVNSSIATNTANFIGTFNSVAELEAYSGTVTNNDYAFVATTDTAGNTLYDRYKYTTATTPASWEFEYELNNSSFTAAQWAAINSGATTTNIGLISTALQPGDVTSSYSSSGTAPVNGTAVASAISGLQAANTAVTHTASTAVGNSTTPVYVASDGTATALSYTIEKSVPSNAVFTDTTYSNFTGADSTTGGAAGLVPAPSSGDEDKYLKGDGTWNAIPAVTVDQTYDSTSANAQSGVAIAGVLDNFVARNVGTTSILNDGTTVDCSYEDDYYYSDLYIDSSSAQLYYEDFNSGDNSTVQAKADGILLAYTSGNGNGVEIRDDSNNNIALTVLNNNLAVNGNEVQTKLVSGTNIKTINNNSLLGSGNITIDSLPSQSGQSGKFLTTNGTTASWSTISIPTVDQTFNSSSANAQSGVAIAGELANYLQTSNGNITFTNGGTVGGITYEDSGTGEMYGTFIGYTPFGHGVMMGAVDPNGYLLGVTSSGINILKGTTASPTNGIALTVTNNNTLAIGGDEVATQTWVGNQGYLTSAALSTLTDVALSNPTQGQNLTYDATLGKWKNTSTTATVAWGGITGTLADQTDLNTALSGKQATLVSGTNIKTINSTSLLGSGDIAVLQNTATGTNSLTILGTATSSNTAINIGYNSSTTTGGTVAIGTNASTSGTASISIGANTESSGIDTIAIGDTAKATANNAIQIGYGTNNTANKFNVRSHELLDLSTGLIPDARISTNIARASDIPTKISDLTDDTATNPVDKADTLTGLTATVTELNYTDGVTSNIQTQFDTITGKIPSQATSSNQLADKAFVNSSVQTATANFRGNWGTWALVPTSASSYPADYAGSTTPTVNDYLVVQDASDYTGDTLEGTWRFKYTGTWSTDGKSGWNPEYQVNETPLTSAQLAALNSGITSSDVTLIGTALQPSDITNMVTTDTDQNITGTKTYVGQKKIGFKQSSSSDKLGFTLYNNSGTEKGYLEYNPSNTVDSVPLMTLGNYATASGGLTHVGFRKYSSISGASGAYNLLAPLISDARTPFSLTTTYTNFYLPLGFTDGTTTVKTAKTGVVDLSSILPDISTKQDTLVSGTNIKTINSTSLLGSGDISVLQNTATGTNSLTILGTANSMASAINIGYNSKAVGNYSIAIGRNAETNGQDAIQIGYGTNTIPNTLSIGFENYNDPVNYTLLNGLTGLIPDARISSNIARSSAIPTKISDLIDDTSTYPIDKADTLTGLTSTVSELNVLDGITASTTELNYTDGVTSNIQTQLNSKVNTSDIWYDSTSKTLYIGVAQS